ncbi:MAG: hypothetical protein LUC27_05175 [Lachnospiraceae bacterium]|nr:hypothetical protein [Lachnospiraceae bacterium]
MSFIITLIFLIWIIQLVRRAQTKGKQEAAERQRTGYGSTASRSEKHDPGRVTPTIPRPEIRKKNATAKPSRSAANQKHQTVQQQLVDANGITFRGLRPGTDELEYLIQYNRARESRLEQALESRQG